MSSGCSCGSTFYILGHLWIVIAEIPGSVEQFIIVSLTTKRSGSDPTVVFQSGDHAFIKHDTVVNYNDARLFPKTELIKRIREQDFAAGDDFEASKLSIIQKGLLDSPFTPNEIKDAYKKSLSN